ncbi:MAG: autotransporter assembly complex family protein [Burkholderiaceae bacterium]
MPEVSFNPIRFRAAYLVIACLVVWLTGCASTQPADSSSASTVKTGPQVSEQQPALSEQPSVFAGEGEAPGEAIDETQGNLLEEALGAVAGPPRADNYAFEVNAPEALIPPIRERTFVGRWQRRADFQPVQFEGLVAQLEGEVQAILRSRGYFNGKVKVSADQQRVSVTVMAGARTTVNLVELTIIGEAQDDIPVRNFALSKWELPEGSFFDSAAWQDGKRNLIEALHQQGFLRARITNSQAQVKPELTAASLRLTVDSGERLQFGDLEVTGLERYDLRTVADLRPFKEGEPYTLDVLLLYQARLRSSGFFSNVLVLPRLDQVASDPELVQVPLKVELTERQTKRAALGIGLSSDEGPRGQIGLEHRDLFNRNWQLQSALVVSAKRQRAFANIRTPYEADGYFNGFGARVEREDIEGLISTASNTYVGRGRRVGTIETFLSVQYQTEQQRIAAGSGAQGRTFSQSALVLGYSWNLRRLDSTIDPRDGYTISAQISGARQGWFSDQTFLRFYTRAIRFQPLPQDSAFKDGTLVLLGEVGIVSAQSRDGIPSENLFRTGGAQTIRGYRFRSLGVADAGAIVGGRYALLGSVEYQHRMSDLYSLAAFFDYGNAVDTRQDYIPFAGYGVGVRFRTPIGPVNLDLAYGHQANRLRAHFSVGYTF